MYGCENRSVDFFSSHVVPYDIFLGHAILSDLEFQYLMVYVPSGELFYAYCNQIIEILMLYYM